MMGRLIGSLGIVVAGAALLAAGDARAGAVTVIGGGLAQACSRAAMAGQSEVKFQNLCSTALETELLDPRDRAGTYVNRGVMKLRKMAYADATRDFDRAAKIRPNLGEAYVNRGAASIGDHRFADSLPDLNKGLELGIEEPAKAYYNRALAYEGLDDMKAAYFDYQKAVELSPEWAAPKEQLTRFTVLRR
ncbi:MAG: tetratricopeptide repeat protein [Phenylobacterium sp.]